MLEGLMVVEMATYIAGPSAAGLLADWGADVIKVESSEGDPARRLYDTDSPNGVSPVFEMDNRGKRSVVLDIRSPEGRDAMLALLSTADVFITSVRHGALRRAGLDFDSLHEINPCLIHASVSAYGSIGPDAGLPGFDNAAFWARSGIAGMITPEGAEHFPLRTGMGDHSCALALALGVMTALFDRTRTGVGRRVEASLLRSGTFALGSDLSVFLRTGRTRPQRPQSGNTIPLLNFFRSADGQPFMLMPRLSNADWPKIATVAERTHLIEDPRFSTPEQRQEHVAELVSELSAGLAALPFAELVRRFTEADLVWAPVQSLEQVSTDPQASAAGCFLLTEDDGGEPFRLPAGPVEFPGREGSIARAVPALGEHTHEILSRIKPRQQAAE